MSYTQALRGGSTVTNSSFTDYDNVAYYDSVTWPGGNYNRDGVRICVIESVSISGGTGVTAATVSSDGLLRFYGGTPRLNFQRNTGVGGAITCFAGPAGQIGTTWAGGVCGSFTWSTVPTAPATITPTRTGRDIALALGTSASDGGQAISSYKVQRAESSDNVSWGAWTDEQTVVAGAYTYVGLTAGKYHKFRVYAVNVRGNGAATASASTLVPAGGKRKSGGVFASTTIAKRKSAGTMIDLTTAKRRVSGSWVDLS